MKQSHAIYKDTMTRVARETAVAARIDADALHLEFTRYKSLGMLKKAREVRDQLYAARQSAIQTSVRAIRHD